MKSLLGVFERLFLFLFAALILILATSQPTYAYKVDTVLDRFSGGTISADRWRRVSADRRIENGKLVIVVSTSSQTKQLERNRVQATLTPVIAIESTVSLTQADLSARNAEAAFARLDGTFYNTEASSALKDYFGDVWAAVYIGDRGAGVEAWYVIQKSTSSDWSTYDEPVNAQLIAPGTLQMNTPYPTKIAYDGGTGFVFSVNGTSSSTVNGPPRGIASENNSVRCGAGVDLGPDGDDFPITAEAQFDDVKLNNSATVYDAFNGINGGQIDQTKWRGRGDNETAELSRYVDSGKLNMMAVGQSNRAIARTFIDSIYKNTSFIESKVILRPGDLPPGTEGRARISGYWYNRLPPASQDHFKGNIWTQFILRKEAGGRQRVIAHITAVTDQFHVTPGDELVWHSFSTPFEFNKEHLMSIRFDETSKKLIFKFDGETYTYNIPHTIYPVPEGNFKALQVQTDSGPGTVHALYDDVRIGIDSPFTDAAPLSHQQWVEAVANNNISTGCGGTLFCPDLTMPRSAAAIWLLRAIEGGGYTPPAASGTVFNDVGVSTFGADFIEELRSRSITDGCNTAGNLFCPKEGVTKVQAAFMILKAVNKPPTLGATGTIFSDVGMNDFGAAWIEQLYREGIADGCEPGKFCPNASVSTTGFAKMLSKAFSLTP